MSLKTIKLMRNRKYYDDICVQQNWLQSVIGIPNLTSDVLLVLDCYVEEFSRRTLEKPITHLFDKKCPWARYGIIAAGYARALGSPGAFSDCFISTLEDLAHSGRLVNCASVMTKLREGPCAFEDGMKPIVMGNDGGGVIILAPIQT